MDIIIIFETLAILALIVGFYYEDKLVKFEDRLLKFIKRRGKG